MALTITANNQTKVYGAALPTLTASYSGFVNGDTSANLTTQPTLTTTATAASHVAGSPYTITAAGAVDADYTITYVAGSLTVTPAPLTITANNQAKIYGAAVPALTASYTGFVNGDSSASLTTLPAMATTATAASHVAGNPYTITASGAADADYAITYVAGSLTVTPAPLTITADNQTKVYGAGLPTLTASYTGFVNGDTAASLDSLPTFNTTATTSSALGVYTIAASGAVDADYAISYTSGTLTVTAAGLTITAVNQTKLYGAALPTLTASYTGFINGDTSSSLTTQPTLTTTATASSHVAGNPYTITAGGAVDPNYSITYVTGNLTVTPAPLTITANSQTKTYGAALPALTLSYTGFVNGDTSASLTTQPTLTTTATASSHVSGNPYTITASGAVDADYAITYAAGTLTINPVALTITANNQAKVYGAALPTLTASYSGFVNGDTADNLTTQPTLNTTATASSPVAGNPYTVTASGAADSDYTISYASGTLTITAAALTITANNQTKVYGAAVPTLTASYTGFVNGDTSATLTTQPTLTTTATVRSNLSANPYPINASGAVDSDYAISYAPGNLTVTPAALVVTANNQTKVYGAALPTLTVSYTGFVAGDTAANLTTQPTLTTTATVSSHIGSYTITASGAVDPNYTISYADGTLTVTTAALTITADNQTNIYGDTLPTLTASYTGFVNGDSSDSLTIPPTLTTTATAASHVANNPYVITAIGAVDSDYTISYVAGSLTVTPAALTITADNQTKAYGDALPTLTASYTGFVNGDSSDSLTIPPTLTTSATAGSPVAGNPFTITASGAVDSDYSISSVSGTLNVTPVALTITADNQTKLYGAGLPTLTATYTGFVNGDTAASLDTQPTFSTTATAASDTGAYTITASGTVDADYTISYVGGTLTVTPATLAVTGDNLTRPEGTANPPLTYTITGLVNGDTNSVVSGAPILSTTATIVSAIGQYPIEVTIGALSATNYDFTTANGILTVTDTPITTIVLTASPGSTSTYGQALTFTATISAFSSGDPIPTGTVEFEADGIPIGSAVVLVNGVATSDSIDNLDAGTQTIEAIYSGDSFYNANSQLATQTVTPAALTITADNQTKLYGAAVPTLTATYTGFVNGDTSASLTTLPTLSTTATVSSNISGNPYTITASGAVDSNYTISYATGSLTITPTALTITADNQTMVYGAALPTLTATYSGFVAGDTAADLTTQPTLTTSATASSHVASYVITASGAVDPDYTISCANGTFTVTTAALTITADNQTMVYGTALPTLTASYTGFVNGDTSSSLTTLPTLTTTATTASHVADNPYAIAASGAVDSDYTISYVAGSLTVTPATLTITADDQTKAYGDALPTLTASYSGFVNNDSSDSLTTLPTLTTSATASSPVAGNPYTITAAGAVDSDYSISYVSGTLNVTPVALTITADNQTVAVHNGVDGVCTMESAAHQDIHQWLSIGHSRDGLLPVIPPAQDRPWLWGGMVTAAFELQTSRSLRTLHLPTRPARSLASL